jgi:hypothetical protein
LPRGWLNIARRQRCAGTHGHAAWAAPVGRQRGIPGHANRRYLRRGGLDTEQRLALLREMFLPGSSAG